MCRNQSTSFSLRTSSSLLQKRQRNPNYSNYLFGTDKVLTKNVIEQINPETKTIHLIPPPTPHQHLLRRKQEWPTTTTSTTAVSPWRKTLPLTTTTPKDPPHHPLHHLLPSLSRPARARRVCNKSSTKPWRGHCARILTRISQAASQRPRDMSLRVWRVSGGS